MTGSDNWPYETTKQIFTNGDISILSCRALNSGAGGNKALGDLLTFETIIGGVQDEAPVMLIDGGVDDESDNDLPSACLRRIQQPPMGGAAYDYEAWALAVPGVTRAWAASEMGIGTVTVRFMMDDLRADNDGIAFQEDLDTVETYSAHQASCRCEGLLCCGTVEQEITCVIDELVPDNEGVRAEIEQSLNIMLRSVAVPGQTIFAAWKSYAIMNTTSVIWFHMANNEDDVMLCMVVI